jgi:hypothetical protein
MKAKSSTIELPTTSTLVTLYLPAGDARDYHPLKFSIKGCRLEMVIELYPKTRPERCIITTTLPFVITQLETKP